MFNDRDSYRTRLENKLQVLTINYHQGIVDGKTFEELHSVVQSVTAIRRELQFVTAAKKD